jgi:hypothetical protein
MAILNELARLLFVLPEAQADLLRFLVPDFLEEYDVFAARQLDTQFVITIDEAGTRTELRLDLLFLVPAREPSAGMELRWNRAFGWNGALRAGMKDHVSSHAVAQFQA